MNRRTVMVKNRYNTPRGAIPDYTPREEKSAKVEVTLTFTPCLICKKEIKEGYYGRWIDGGTCCKTCEAVKEAQPRNFGE